VKTQFNKKSNTLITLYFPMPLFSIILLLHLQLPSLNAHITPTSHSHMVLNARHYSLHDGILPLPSHVVDDMINNSIHMVVFQANSAANLTCLDL
jgi:hypothetical protein